MTDSVLARACPDHQAFLARYLGGYCDALAIALSTYANLPVRALYPVHVAADGSRRRGEDYLHAYALCGDLAWDAKGKRTEAQVLADFKSFLDSLIKPDEACMDVEAIDYGDAEEFVAESGCNPGPATLALEDAVVPLGLDAGIVAMTRRALVPAGMRCRY